MQLILEAISDPTRRKILDLLKKAEMSAGELGKHFDDAAQFVSGFFQEKKETKK